jgi:predicted permease
MTAWLRRIRARLRHRHFADDVAREIDVHRAMAQDELESQGASPADARRATARALGNVTSMREDARHVWIAPWLESAWQDLRYAWRGCVRGPWFTAGVVSMLAVGLALATSVFTFADATFLRRWRVPDAASMAFIRPARPGGISLPELRYLQAHSRTMSAIVASVRGRPPIAGNEDGREESVDAMYVTANYFDALRVGVAIGRGFGPGDDDVGAPNAVAIISERWWRERFDRDPAIVGRTIRLSGSPFTVVGVTTRGFVDIHSSRYELWLPLGALSVDRAAFVDPHAPQPPLDVIGRLAPGATRDAASAELTALSDSFAEAAGVTSRPLVALDTRPIAAGRIDGALQITVLLLAAVLLVQLLACANVGNLLLARGLARERELAIRLAIGASRTRIVRQLVTEAAVLASLAGTLGVALAAAVPSIVFHFVSEWPERPEFYTRNAAVYAFALSLVLITTLVAGLTPALRVVRRAAAATGSDRHTNDRRARRLRGALLAVQIALATALLLGASLLTRSISHALAIDPGFPLREIQEISVRFPAGAQLPRRSALYRTLREQSARAGLPMLAFADDPPFADSRAGLMLRRPDVSNGPTVMFTARSISAHYFDVVGIRLIAGRALRDDDDDRRELVVSRMAARRIWGDDDPIGRVVIAGFGATMAPHTIVGVAADVPVRSPNDIEPVVYQRTHDFAPIVLVRTSAPAAISAVRAAAMAIDPGVTLDARPLADNVRDALGASIAAGWIAWAIGGLGLVLAAAGACGAFAFAVEERRTEIGIRLALGARAAHVLGLVLTSARTAVVGGLAVGGGLAAAVAVAMQRFLYGLSPFDPMAYVLVAGVLSVAAGLATWVPARRALRVDPAVTLRGD